MRVLIAPVEVSGIAQGLYEGFSEIGVDSQVCLSLAHPFKYSGNKKEPWVLRVWQFLGGWRSKLTRASLFQKPFSVVLHNLWGFVVLFWAIFRFDSFIFLYALTLTNTKIELWLLRLLGRKIVFIYAGSDSRPPFMDGGFFAGAVSDPIPSARNIFRLVRGVKSRVAAQEKYADFVVCSPASAQYLTLPFVDWFLMGIPKSFASSGKNSDKGTGVVRILHAPSNSGVKGTATIMETLERLREKGHLIEVILLENKSNSEVLEALQNCDFIVDQLYADTPLAALAAEAAFFGKPAIVAGYFSGFVQSHVRKENIPPSLFVMPCELEAAIERLIVDRCFRFELGLKAQNYVRTRWSPKHVALRYHQLLVGHEIPSDWWVDPYSIRYVDGNGLDRRRTAKLVRELVNSYGSSALMLADKPALEQALLSMANQAGCGDTGA